MIKSTFLFVFLAFIAFSCSGPEKLLTNTNAERIYFGKSGGFTNIPMAYVLIDRTYVYKIDKNNFTAIRKPGKNEIADIKLLLDSMNFYNLILNEPGNMTYYIRIVKENKEKEIKWSDTSSNDQVKELYNALISTVKQ